MHDKAHFSDDITFVIVINGLEDAFLVHLNLLHPLRIIRAEHNFRRFDVNNARMTSINGAYHITPMMNECIQFKLFQ